MACSRDGRYEEKLSLLLSSGSTFMDPYQIPKDKWVDGPTKWPKVNLGTCTLEENQILHGQLVGSSTHFFLEIWYGSMTFEPKLIDSPGIFTKEKSLHAYNYKVHKYCLYIL